MVINSVPFGNESLNPSRCAQGCFGLNSTIFPLQELEIDEKIENRANTPVPMTLYGRYYSHSKPGGPLSQDTHTSSGLSIYGLGVGA